MRLTDVLFRLHKKLPGGHLWRGKHRLYKKVRQFHLNELKQKYELEEENMFYLRHPYLTPEQSYGHATALGKGKEWVDNKRRAKGWQDHKYLGDRLGFLKVKDAWE